MFQDVEPVTLDQVDVPELSSQAQPIELFAASARADRSPTLSQMEGHPVWFELHVRDVGRAEAFYNAVAGWKFESLDGMAPESYRMISETPAGVLGGALVSGFPERSGSGTVIYIAVENLEHAIATAQAHGGEVESTRQTINDADGAFALVRDPDGNLLGLWTS